MNRHSRPLLLFLLIIILPYIGVNFFLLQKPAVVDRIYPDDVPTEVNHLLGNAYDDAVTVQALRAFRKDGLGRTAWLGNRRGLPSVSMFDIHQDQCRSSGMPVTSGGERFQAVNYLGQPIDLTSLNQDCVYTHYPSFTILVYWIVEKLGGDLFAFRMLSVLLTALTLIRFFQFTQRLTSPFAAFLATSLLTTAPSIFLWGSSLFYQSFQLYFLMYIIDGSHQLGLHRHFMNQGRIPKRILFAYLLVCLSSPEFLFFVPIYLIAVFGFQRTLRPAKLIGNGFRLSLVVAAYALVQVGQTILFYGSLEAVWSDWSTTLRNRAVAFSVDAEVMDPKWILLDRLPKLINDEVLPWWALLAMTAILTICWFWPRRRSQKVWLSHRSKVGSVLLLAAFSFPLVFPHTALRHHWVLYRHIDFGVYTLLAVAMAGLPMWTEGLGRRFTSARNGRNVGMALALCLWVPVQIGFMDNIQSVWRYFDKASTVVNASNAMSHALDFTAWNENPQYVWLGGSRSLPLDGIVHDPRQDSFQQPFALAGDSRFLVVYRQTLTVTAIRINTPDPDRFASLFSRHCEFLAFDGSGFQPILSNDITAENQYGTRWSVFKLPDTALQGLLVRCNKSPELGLYELRVDIRPAI